MKFDLLSTVEYGGCSAKLSAQKLSEALSCLTATKHPNLLVDIDTHDDAGVYKITDEIALIQTVDFFPPICSDAFEFGEIAAANALSDVYAMGGEAINAMNIICFPSTKIPMEVLGQILMGGDSKVKEAECVIVGGHTIDDYPPKYGLAVTGIVNPKRIIANSGALAGDLLILTKPIGTGVIVAGKRIDEVKETDYRNAIENMKALNKMGARIMQKFNVRCAVDITGFGLLGHALKMAQASKVTIKIDVKNIPLLNGAHNLVKLGCIPGAAFRNLEYVENDTLFNSNLDYNLKMLALDPQTSGGLFLCAKPADAKNICTQMIDAGYLQTAIVGEVLPKADKFLEVN